MYPMDNKHLEVSEYFVFFYIPDTGAETIVSVIKDVLLKARPNGSNMLMQLHPALLHPTCCTRLATMLHDVA